MHSKKIHCINTIHYNVCCIITHSNDIKKIYIKITLHILWARNKNADLIITIIYRQHTQVPISMHSIIIFCLIVQMYEPQYVHFGLQRKIESENKISMKRILRVRANNKHNIELCERNCCCLGVGESLHGAEKENYLT